MTPDQKLEHRLSAWLTPPVTFVSPEAEAAYRARVTRLADAMLLRKTPDRVPVPLLVAEGYPAKWGGVTSYDAMYDFERGSQAFVDFNLEFQPDAMVPPIFATVPGSAFDVLDYRLFSWPGHGVPRDAGMQYNEKEWMKAEEYDEFIADPVDFLLRRRAPRIYGALQGFSGLGYALDTILPGPDLGYFASWTRPEVLEKPRIRHGGGQDGRCVAGQDCRRDGAATESRFPPVLRPHVPGALRRPGRYIARDQGDLARPLSQAGEGAGRVREADPAHDQMDAREVNAGIPSVRLLALAQRR
jgi:hypothetical protein